jgi:putative sigma-54 modulation protein
MGIIVSGRHVEVTDSMKEYAENKLNAILEDKHKISSARIVLNLEKTRHTAEVIVHGKGLNVEADSESYDMYESIDTVMGKIERQIERYFDKKQDHHKASHISKPVAIDEDDENDFEYEEE